MSGMRRREFITLLGGAAVAWPLAARAQQPAMPVIGFLSSASPDLVRRPCARVPPGPERDRLCRRPERGDRISLGGRPISIDLPALAADLVRRQVDVIAATGSTPAALAAKAATTTIPIVFADRRRPGRGWTCRQPQPTGRQPHRRNLFDREVGPKRLELLHELCPRRPPSRCSSTRPVPIAETHVERPAGGGPHARAAAPCPACQHRTRPRYASSQPWPNCEPARS